jgi:cytochrome c oxidase cbb3-type subunit 4
MDYSFLSSIMTVVSFVVFVSIVVWAWSGKRREDFEAAARVPLEDDVEPVVQQRRQAGH